jgi:hypothetical protein
MDATIRRLLVAALAACLAMIPFACKGGGIVDPSPFEGVPEGVSKSIVQTIALVERAITEEDPNLASNQVADIFRMDGLVAFRFRRSNAPAQPTQQTNLAVFLNDFFRDNQNILVEFTVSNITQNGDLATADLDFHLSATYAVESPPVNYFVDSLDRVTFQREIGAWKLIAWEEVEEVSSGDENNSGDLEPIVLINRAVNNLEEMVNTKNFKLKDKTISSIFAVDADVGERFYTPGILAGDNPNPNFEAFFNDVFAYNENIVFSLTVTNWDIAEDVATVTVEFSPEATDQINFRLEDDGYWRIISWVEAPAGGPEPDARELCRLTVLNLQEAIRGEDLTLISDSLAPGFYLHPDIARRFRTHVSESGDSPSQNLYDYMPIFFSENVNVDFQLALTDFVQNGDVAFGTLAFNLNATYIVDFPATPYTLTRLDDQAQFLNTDGTWRIMLWLPKDAALPPTDEESIRALLSGIGSAITERRRNDATALFNSLFTLPQDVALLFPTHYTIEDPPPSDLAAFLDTFLSENANVAATVAPDTASLSLNGELAEIEADVTIVSDYIPNTPATHFDATTRCVFELTKSGGEWLVYRWTIAAGEA